MKTKGISPSSYDAIDNCLTAQINQLQELVRTQNDPATVAATAELLGKVKAARSEFISVHVA